MPFLWTMPMPMIAPRNATTLRDGAGEVQCDDDAEHRKHRAEDDGDRGVERAKFQQRHREDQDDRQASSTIVEIAERFLLLLVRAAVFDRAGGKRRVIVECGADLAHGAAQVAALKFGGDGDVLPQIVAMQFHFAGRFDDIGHLIERIIEPSAARSGRSPELLQSIDRLRDRPSRGC